MSHMIDQTTGKSAIAYVGETPWHGLGQELTAGADIETWTVEAGLAWEARRASVEYNASEENGVDDVRRVVGRSVLYRSDTSAPLGIVSDGYKIVQPVEVMEFFSELAQIGGFSLNTAGALSDGKRIWALAKVHEGAPIVANDIVEPYLLLSTSFDGSMATTAKLTAIRVVCHNTITASLNEKDTATVKVAHNSKFDPVRVREQLGIFTGSFDKWMLQAKRLAEGKLSPDAAAKMTAMLVEPTLTINNKDKGRDVTKSKPFTRIMDLFNGEAIGHEMAGMTKWGWLNSVTQFVDHERGENSDSRLSQAWFGTGDNLKKTAQLIALA